jgi:hypothetical protein
MSDLLMYTLYAPTWTARKLDKKATKQVKESNGVKDGINAGNFNKLILPDCAELTTIQSYIGTTRNEFYLRSAAWGEQRGIRVGKAENHMDTVSWFGDRKAGLEPLKDALGAVYPAKIAQAEYDMHGLFDIADYPSWDVVREKFQLDLYPQPLPNAEDIRTMQDIPADQRAAIEADMEQRTNAAFAGAVAEAFTMLMEPIAHMAKQLRAYTAGDAKRLHESLHENIRMMAAAARRLNLTNDPDIEEMAVHAEELVAGVTKDDLKDNDLFRASKAKEAEALAARIAKFLP